MTIQEYIPSQYFVLVVEDDPIQAEPYIEELQQQGLIPHHVTGFNSAKQFLSEKRFHAALLDKKVFNEDDELDGEGGFKIAEYILEHYRDISCLMFTSNPTRIAEKQARLYPNMFDYYEKVDISPSKAAAVIFAMLQKRKTIVMSQSGMPVEADQMYFYGKIGTAIRKVSNSEGVVELDGEKWKATTHNTEGIQTIIPIAPGSPIRAYGISNRAIEVVSLNY